MEYTEINAATIDRWCREGWEWGKPLSKEKYEAAKLGQWDVLLTPTRPVPHGWFGGDIRGKRLLGLASGGAQQMPVFAALGADCAVLDYSESQIESEREYAAREGYAIDILRADMTKPLPFADASFDMVVNPVSVCYVQKIEPIWREVVRVLRPGGVFIAGFDTGYNYITDEAEERIVRGLPYDPIANPQLLEQDDPEEYGVQFSHTPGEILSSLLRAGLVIDDAYDDVNGEGRLSELGIPTMLAIRAHKAG